MEACLRPAGAIEFLDALQCFPHLGSHLWDPQQLEPVFVLVVFMIVVQGALGGRLHLVEHRLELLDLARQDIAHEGPLVILLKIEAANLDRGRLHAARRHRITRAPGRRVAI